MLFELILFSRRRFSAKSNLPFPAKAPKIRNATQVSNGNMDGIDISNYQSGISLGSVSADFLIFKATEGNRFVDSSFTSWANWAKSNGKLFGFYHFVNSPSVGGSFTAQAQYFYNAVKSYVGTGIPFLDWEDASYSSVLSYGPSGALEFLNKFYELSGIRAMIYMSQSVTKEYDWSTVCKTYKLWMAQYASMDPVHGYEDSPWRTAPGHWSDPPTIHQYSSAGYLSGYSSELDLDKAYISSAQWKEIAEGK